MTYAVCSDDVDASDMTSSLAAQSDAGPAAAAAASQRFDAVSDHQQVCPPATHQLYTASLGAAGDSLCLESSGTVTSPPPPPMAPKKSPAVERGSSSAADYRRSERGLSFLFPSFSDHGMSLLDKVHMHRLEHFVC